jgi:molecular chaperone IbpA
MRTAYDFSPLYRSVIGVDRMADLIKTAMRTGVTPTIRLTTSSGL